MTTHLRGNAPGLFFLALAAILVGTVPAHAQRNPSGLPSPRLYTVFPAGGKAGSSFQITLAGLHLEEPERILFSNPGIKAEPLPQPARRSIPRQRSRGPAGVNDRRPISSRSRSPSPRARRWAITTSASSANGESAIRARLSSAIWPRYPRKNRTTTPSRPSASRSTPPSMAPSPTPPTSITTSSRRPRGSVSS